MTPPTPRSHIPDTGNMVRESKMPEPLAMVAQFMGEWRETGSVHAQPVYTAAQMREHALEAARQAMEQRWISVEESLPEERARPYQVVAINRKKYGPMSVYAGEGIRSVLQDWVVRRWPHNLTHWMHMPPPPAEIARAAEAGGKENHG